VGQIVANYKNRFTLDYRFQLDNHDLSSRRHEVGATTNIGPVSLYGQYLFANPIEGAVIDDNREQLQVGAAYAATDEWRFRTATLHDLGGVDPGLRRASFGVDYTGECFTVSSTLDRNLTRNSSGESSTEIYFRIGLKNLGEFETSGISLGSSSDDDDDNKSILPPP
jgi:LPS-assembly protein